MSANAYAARLEELELNPHDAKVFEHLSARVAPAVAQMRVALVARKAKENERVWRRQQAYGELDDARIVDGIAGEQNIYRRRATDASANSFSRVQLPKRAKFVVDVSGSMYATPL